MTFVGWLVTMRRVGSKNKTMMKFITLEDREGLVEAVLFDRAYKQYGHLFKGYGLSGSMTGPYVVKGRVQSRLLPINRDLRFAPTGEANLIVDKVEVLVLEPAKIGIK